MTGCDFITLANLTSILFVDSHVELNGQRWLSLGNKSVMLRQLRRKKNVGFHGHSNNLVLFN